MHTLHQMWGFSPQTDAGTRGYAGKVSATRGAAYRGLSAATRHLFSVRSARVVSSLHSVSPAPLGAPHWYRVHVPKRLAALQPAAVQVVLCHVRGHGGGSHPNPRLETVGLAVHLCSRGRGVSRDTRTERGPAERPALARIPRCLCPGCRTPLTEFEKWFCETCRYDVGPGCGCGFVPLWNR